jgi:vacuolar iron transporter family protein
MKTSDEREAYIRSLKIAWRKERASERIYHDLALRETNPSRKVALFKLAETERGHAARWEHQLEQLGAPVSEYHETLRESWWRWVLVQSGTDNALARIESSENDDVDMYSGMAEIAPEQEMRTEIESALHDESTHARAAHLTTSSTMETQESAIQTRLNLILGREKWHKRNGGWIGQAIYGANDGLGSVFGIVSGVAGATAGGPAVLIAGLAGMLASALSMGSGAYLATKAEREMYEAEMRREKRELESHPEEEQEELELFYQLKGMDEDVAKQMAARLIANQDEALRTLASEELGLSEQTFPNHWREAISASLSTAFGAFIPIIPFFFGGGYPAVIASFAISTLAHFLIGAAKTIVTGLSPWKSGLEMMLVGLGEAVITYLLGLIFGQMVG